MLNIVDVYGNLAGLDSTSSCYINLWSDGFATGGEEVSATNGVMEFKGFYVSRLSRL